MTHKFSLVLLLFVLAAPRAFAQSTNPDPDAQAKVRIGPFSMSPTLALTNMGIDNNVFNEPDQLAPKRDFTVTVTPATDMWLRMGHTWITGNVKSDLVYYKKYASERSANDSYKLGWLVPLNRLTFNVNGTYLNTRERPGFEIDARSQRIEKSADGSVEIRVLSKTFFGVRADRHWVNYDKAAVFLDVNLHDELSRVVTTEAITVRHRLTPLTDVTLDISRDEERFEFSHLRDSDSTAVSAGFKFDPFALLKGSATFGYKDFKPLSPDYPRYKGSTAAVNLSYVALGTTKLSVQGTRDVQYSYNINQPYYVLTGVTGTVDQQLYGPLDLQLRAGVQQLAYRDRTDVPIAVPERVDYVHSYGGGIGYRFGTDFRIGVNVDNARRTSKVDTRTYSGLRIGTSVTYGF